MRTFCWRNNYRKHFIIPVDYLSQSNLMTLLHFFMENTWKLQGLTSFCFLLSANACRIDTHCTFSQKPFTFLLSLTWSKKIKKSQTKQTKKSPPKTKRTNENTHTHIQKPNACTQKMFFILRENGKFNSLEKTASCFLFDSSCLVHFCGISIPHILSKYTAHPSTLGTLGTCLAHIFNFLFMFWNTHSPLSGFSQCYRSAVNCRSVSGLHLVHWYKLTRVDKRLICCYSRARRGWTQLPCRAVFGLMYACLGDVCLCNRIHWGQEKSVCQLTSS